MELIVEETTTYDLSVDPDAFATVYADEFAEFREEKGDGEELSEQAEDDELKEFVVHSIHVMGIRDFVAGNPPWLKGKGLGYKEDYDLDVRKLK